MSYPNPLTQLYSYPDEVARQWKSERDAFETEVKLLKASMKIAIDALEWYGSAGPMDIAQDCEFATDPIGFTISKSGKRARLALKSLKSDSSNGGSMTDEEILTEFFKRNPGYVMISALVVKDKEKEILRLKNTNELLRREHTLMLKALKQIDEAFMGTSIVVARLVAATLKQIKSSGTA